MGLTIGLGLAYVGSSGGGGGGNNSNDSQFIDYYFKVNMKIIDNSLSDFPLIDTSYINDMSNMFESCTSLKTVPKIDTSRVQSMVYMFKNCSRLESVPQFDMTNVDRASYMFQNCYALKSMKSIDAPKLLNASGFFSGCKGLEHVSALNTPKVTSMGEMFNGCVELKNIDFVDMSSCTSTDNYTFFNCSKIEKCYLFGVKTNLWMQYSPNLSKESVLYLFENAQTYSGSGTKKITLHADVFSQLREDEIAIATEKGFSVVSA